MSYKKIKVLLLTAALACTMGLSSCGKTSDAPVSEGKEEKEDKDDKEDKEDKEDKDDKEDAGKADKAAKKAYEAFLKGEQTVYFDDSIINQNSTFNRFEGEFTLQELADQVALRNFELSMPDSIWEAKWAYIDCGEDGVSELELELTYESFYESQSPSYEVFIIKNMDNGLKVCNYTTGYYRSNVAVFENGYISYFGSSGAAFYNEDMYVVDADGNSSTLYSLETMYGLGETRIPPEELPGEMEEVLSKDFEYGDKYELHVYRFPDEMPDYEYEEWDYAEQARLSYYLFTDYDGKEVKVDEDYISLCADEGIRIITQKELDKILEKKKKALGLDPKSVRGHETVPELTDCPTDNYSVKVQSQILEDNAGVWMWTYRNEDFTDVSYAVTDLNRNGRLEVIRCEKFENDKLDIISRAYIFEIDEDMKGVSEMDFEQDHNSYISFLPVSDTDTYLSMMAYYKAGEGKYYYVVPTDISTGYGYDELNLIMEMDGNGAKVTGLLSKLESGKKDDDIYYVDGKEVESFEYQLAAREKFPLEDGYSMAQVMVEFENFETADDLLTAIRENATWSFYFSVIEGA